MKNKYQTLVNQTIPISKAIGWHLQSLDATNIISRTELKPNINIHGTGFAGSLFAAAMATGWTLLKCWSDHQHYSNELVAAEASIKYVAPVTEDFICEAFIDINNELYTQLLERLKIGKGASYLQRVDIKCGSTCCAILEIRFVFKSIKRIED
jgi:thioesterase domain-containing protein